MVQMRTHTCGELRLTDAGKQVKLVGFMENVRAVSASLAFVVLRDFYGTTQIVVESEDLMKVVKSLKRELGKLVALKHGLCKAGVASRVAGRAVLFNDYDERVVIAIGGY